MTFSERNITIAPKGFRPWYPCYRGKGIVELDEAHRAGDELVVGLNFRMQPPRKGRVGLRLWWENCRRKDDE